MDSRHVVSGSDDKTVIVWDIETGKKVSWPLRGHTSHVLAVAVSPNGRLIAFGSDDCTIRLWSTTTLKPVDRRALYGHTRWIESISFSPDSTRLVSGGFDRVMRIWDVGENSPDASLHTVSFSDCPQHALDVTDLLEATGVEDPRGLFYFEDGWIKGPDGELLLYVPWERLPGLWWPRTRAIIRGVPKTSLDFSSFPHGEDWARCFPGASSSRA